MSLAIVGHPDYAAPLPAGHRFPMGKFTAVQALLAAERLAPDGLIAPEPATPEALRRAHAADYVEAVLACAVPREIERRIGLPVDAGVVRRACAAVGGTILTARLALERGIACNTAGGSHHARAETGAGFCVFNDVAVAALTLLDERAVRRVLVVDLDVHQGDGTAAIFREDPRVFTFSIHCEDNFPVRKEAGDLDIGLPRGLGDEGYLEALAGALPQAFEAARPDLVFFNAGVDVHGEDQLGRLALTDSGLAAREAQVIEYCRRRGAPLAGVLGGGYGQDVEAVARRHVILHRTAARHA